MSDNKQEIKNAIDVLRKGGLVFFRADTEWVIGGDISNPQVVEKFRSFSSLKPEAGIFIVDVEVRLDNYIPSIPEQTFALLEFAEKPLTIIFNNVKNIDSIFLMQDNKAAFRLSKDELTYSLAAGIRRALYCVPASADHPAFDMKLEQFTSAFSKKDETKIEIGKGGIIRFINAK